MKIEKIYIPPNPQDTRASGAIGAGHVKDADGEADRHGGNAAFYDRSRKKEEKEEDAVIFKKQEEEVPTQAPTPNVPSEEPVNQSSTEVAKKSLRIVV